MAEYSQIGKLTVNPKWRDGYVSATSTIDIDLNLTNGTGVGQANCYWQKAYSITAGATETIDLTALTTNVFTESTSLYLASVKMLLVKNGSTATTITAGGTPSNRWDGLSDSGAHSIGPGGSLFIMNPSGLTITSTSKAIDIENTDTVYSITGNTTTGSASVTSIASTTGLAAGMLVTGSGIPANTKVSSVTSGTAIVLTANATATATGVSLTIQNPSANVTVYVVGVLD